MFLTFLPNEINPLLAISIIFIVGYFAGRLFALIKVPEITGQIIAGVLLGPSVLGLFDHHDTMALEHLTTFAMGLVTFTVGIHLNYRKIHNALRRILCIAVFETMMVFILVFIVLKIIGVSTPSSLILASIATSTAPATVLAIVKENKAKGTFVKKLLSVVALDNIICILVFTIVQSVAIDSFYVGTTGFGKEILRLVWELGIAAFLGIAVGFTIIFAIRKKILSAFTLMFVGIILVLGIAKFINISPLLANLVLGSFLVNYCSIGEKLLDELEHISELIITCFFTIAGINLHLNEISHVGFMGLAYFVARMIGKYLGGILGATVAKSVPRIKWNIGYALIPQAGLANGLIIILGQNKNIPQKEIVLITTLVLGCIALNEIIGPIFTSKSIKKAKERNKDRPRLIEFLEEQFIITDLKAKDKWDAIEKLSEFLSLVHRVDHISTEEIVASIKKRENEFSTVIGDGIAIPHGTVPSGPDIQGVLGISKEGILFDDDSPPVHLIILIVTPTNHRDKHIKVLSSVTRMLTNEVVRVGLFNAKSASQAYEIISSEELETFNYFLDEKAG